MGSGFGLLFGPVLCVAASLPERASAGAVWWYTLGATLTISALALVGILTLYLQGERLHAWLLPMVGFAAGALLGDVFLHLLPELVERKGELDLPSSLLIQLGTLTFFLLEQGLRRWQAEHTGRDDHEAHLAHVSTSPPRPEGERRRSLLHARPFAVVNLGTDLLHNLIDGLVVGGAFLFSTNLGIATTIAVALHEIPQELGDYAVLVQAGLGRGQALLYNFLTALSAVAGGVLALVIGQSSESFSLLLIPFTAGSFIYLAVGDLIPEIQAHGRPGHTASGVVGLIVGIALMVALHFVGGH